VLLASKGLTNGTCAAAAVLVSPQVSAEYDRADATVLHGETQAGTPPTCAAILATISEMRRLDAVARARRVAAVLDTELDRLTATEPLVEAGQGIGCFRAVTLSTPSGPLPDSEIPAVVSAIRDAGAVVHPGPHGFQLIPALTYTDAEVHELFDAVRVGLAAYRERAAVGPMSVGGGR
jgi:adenosylmethionine-8-amino-7-oxononanoate aminotransferase